MNAYTHSDTAVGSNVCCKYSRAAIARTRLPSAPWTTSVQMIETVPLEHAASCVTGILTEYNFTRVS